MANIRANLFFLAVFLISRTYGSIHESEGYAAILFDQSGISDNVYRDSYARNINDILRTFTEVGTTGVSVMSYGQYPLILLNCRETSSDMIMARDHFSTKLALLAPALKALRYMFQECAGRSGARKSIYLIARKKVDDDSFLEVLREAEALKRSGVNIVTIFSYKNKMCLSELNKLSDEKKFQEGCCCEKTMLPEDIVDLGCPPKSTTTEAQLTSTTKQEEFTTVTESEQVDGATHPPTIAKNSLIGTEDKPTALQQTQELVGHAVSPGIKGEPGVPGDRGSTGPDGPQGPQGRSGDAGPQGLKGDKGDIGEPGTLGYTGPAGPKGEPGLKGERGEAGVAGPPGVQGLKGEMGLTGPQGSRGEKGESGKAGDAGEPGPKGEVGPPGDMGDPGTIGAEGLPGLPGKEGERGLQGEPGNSGQPGPTGPQGPMGLKGDKGDQGPPGADGAPGRPGPAGAEGPMGPPGEAGVPGPCGPMGPRGKDGERGYKGSTGSTGPAGVQGPPGEAGSPGPGFFFEVTNDCSCNNASLCLSAYGLKYCLPPPTGCSHNNHGCHHICTDGQKGATCSCREGYVLGPDRKSCQDVDECQSKSLSCPFPLSCVNVIGSFHCLEIRGYDVIDHPGNFSKSILNFTKKFDWSFFLLVSILVSYLVIAVVVVWLIIASRSSRVRHQKLIRILRDQRADLDCSPSVSKV